MAATHTGPEAGMPLVSSRIEPADLTRSLAGMVLHTRLVFDEKQLRAVVGYARHATALAVTPPPRADESIAVFRKPDGSLRYEVIGAGRTFEAAPKYLPPTESWRARSAWRLVLVCPVAPVEVA